MKKKNWWRKKICGVYRICDKVSGKSYIGKSVDVLERWTAHGGIQNSDISRAFWERPTDFVWEVLETCKEAELAAREDFWILLYSERTDGVFNKQIPRGKREKAARTEAEAFAAPLQKLTESLRQDKQYVAIADKSKPLSAHPGPTIEELDALLKEWEGL
jgi:hypothetical protein